MFREFTQSYTLACPQGVMVCGASLRIPTPSLYLHSGNPLESYLAISALVRLIFGSILSMPLVTTVLNITNPTCFHTGFTLQARLPTENELASTSMVSPVS